MTKKLTINILVLIYSILVVFKPAWARSMIQGQVLDSHTGEPIKNAAVQIYWGDTKGIIGMTYGVEIEVGEDLTDAQGYFKIPKYSWFKGYHYYMHIYKKGYVCWNKDKIFPTYEERKNFRLKDGMVIKLEGFKEEYSKEKHAIFAISVFYGPKYIYDKATKSEQELLYRIAQERRVIQKAQWEKDQKERKAFIDCMRKVGKGKYHIRKFCDGIWSSRFIKELKGLVSARYSSMYKAMEESGVTIEYEEETDFPNIYIIKK